MKYNTIIFIYSYIITLRDYHRFELDYLESRGYNVIALTVWAKNAIRDFDFSAGVYEGDNYECIELRQFSNYIKNHANSIYFFNGYRPDCIISFNLIGRTGSKYIITGNHGAIHMRASDKVDGGNNNGIVNKIKKYGIKLYIACYYIKRNISQTVIDNKLKKVESKPFLITNGTSTKIGVPDRLIDNNLVYTHALDYDRYIENEREGIIPSEEYIVYIEGGFVGLDQDSIMAGCEDYVIDVLRFERQLTNVFKKLEEHYNIPIVIAGHPHAHYSSDEFCGRKILLGQTEKLIPHARLVIMQMSTSINQVLIYNKELLILYNDDFKHMDNFEWLYTDWLKPTCEFLGLKECNVDNEDALEHPYNYVSKPSDEARKKYIEKYIKMDNTPEKLNIEVIEEKIRQLN